MPNSVYWDACLFIEVLQKIKGARLDACHDMIDKAEKKSLIIVTSALTITEVNKFGDQETSTLSREDQSKMILAFFGNPYIRVRAVDRRTAEYAHDLTRLHGLKNIDAIHAATAALAKVDVLYTYDGKKGRRDGLLTHDGKIGNPPLSIKEPPPPSGYPLFDKPPKDDGKPPQPEASVKPNGSTQS